MSPAIAQIPRGILAAALKNALKIDLDPLAPSFDVEAARAVTLLIRGDDLRWEDFQRFVDKQWLDVETAEFPTEPGALQLVPRVESNDNLADNEPTGWDPSSANAYGASKGTVMVVDDSRASRAVMRDLLQREGYAVVLAEDGWDALGKLNSSAPHGLPDMLFVDVMMPRINGFQLVQIIQQEVGLQGLPIVMMTAAVAETWKPMMAGYHADEPLPKPLDQSTVRGQVEKYIPSRNVAHG